MSDIDESPRRRRGTWSARAPWNRIVYALAAGWLVWLATGRPSEWLILPVAAVAWAALTGYFALRDRQAGTDRQR